jgi:hypothetical protein
MTSISAPPFKGVKLDQQILITSDIALVDITIGKAIDTLDAPALGFWGINFNLDLTAKYRYLETLNTAGVLSQVNQTVAANGFAANSFLSSNVNNIWNMIRILFPLSGSGQDTPIEIESWSRSAAGIMYHSSLHGFYNSTNPITQIRIDPLTLSSGSVFDVYVYE